MATFEVEGQNGKRYQIEAPDAATVMRAAEEFLSKSAEPDTSSQMVGYTDQNGERQSQEFFLNPQTGQMTSRELLANAPASTAEAAGRGYMQGYSWNAADEGMGAANAVIPGPGTPEQRADFGREYSRARQEASWRDAPLTTLGSTIVGGATSAYNLGQAGNALLGMFGRSVAPAATTGQSIARTAAAGAVGGGVEGVASGEGAGDRMLQGAVGTVAGAVLGPTVGYGFAKLVDAVGEPMARRLRGFFSNKEMYNRNTGEITENGQRALRALGVNLDDVSARMQREMARTAEDATSGRVPQDAIEGVAAARSFDIPLTRGQTTGDIPQIATEQSFRAGVSPRAGAIMNEFDTNQRNAVSFARDSIVDGSGAGVNKIDAADDVINAVRRQADAARGAGSAAYDVLDQSGAAIRSDAIGPLRRQIELGVRSEGVAIDAGTPNANTALNILENAFKSDNGGSVPFMQIERARQRLNRLRNSAKNGSNGADGIAMDQIVDKFDGWLDDTITTALESGDDAVISQAKDARALWRQYKETFLSKKGADNYIRKIVEDDVSPDQVAGWLFGGARHVGGGRTSLVAKRLKNILGEDSPEWQDVRRAAWNQVTLGKNGEPLGPDAIVSNIDTMLNEKGKTLSNVLFSENEQKLMREFRAAINRIRVPRMANNPSGSGYEVQRAVNRAVNWFVGMLSASQGGPVAGVATERAVSAAGGWRAAVAARAAANGIKVPTISPAATGGGTAAAIGAAPAAATNLLNQGQQPAR